MGLGTRDEMGVRSYESGYVQSEETQVKGLVRESDRIGQSGLELERV